MKIKAIAMGIWLGLCGVGWGQSPEGSGNSADAPSTRPSSNESLFAQATEDAKERMTTAEAAAARELEKSAPYLEAKIEVARQSARLEQAKAANDVQARVHAATDLAVARRTLKALLMQKLERDKDYVEAKKQYDSLIQLSKVPDEPLDPIHPDAVAPNPAARDRDTALAIRNAVESHNFLTGMTFKECCTSAGAQPDQQETQGDTKYCRWTLRGPVPTQTVIVQGQFVTLKEYRVIGYVHATFENNLLINYERRDTSDIRTINP